MSESCCLRARLQGYTTERERSEASDRYRETATSQPERIDHRFFEHRYRDGKASYTKAKEWSSDASDVQYRRYQQKPESLSSHNNLLQPAMFADAPTSPSVSSTKTAREQRRSFPKSDVRGESDKEYLESDEVEQEITCPIVGTTAASPCGHIFCGGCGLEWIRANETCPICRKQLATPASLSLVPLHVMDALVQKVWEAQRVVWREDLAAIEGERKHRMEERERGQQNQGSHEQSFSHIDGPQPALGDFLLTDLLSLGVHGGVPVMASSAQMREYIRPDPISSFLDEVSRLRREIRTERDHNLSTTLQASSHSPSILSSRSPHAADPRSFGHEEEWEVYSPYSWNAALPNCTMHPHFGLAAGNNAGLASSIEDLGSRFRDLWTGVSRS